LAQQGSTFKIARPQFGMAATSPFRLPTPAQSGLLSSKFFRLQILKPPGTNTSFWRLTLSPKTKCLRRWKSSLDNRGELQVWIPRLSLKKRLKNTVMVTARLHFRSFNPASLANLDSVILLAGLGMRNLGCLMKTWRPI